MLVIARGLMARPRLLLIDEPSLGLSPLIMSRIYEVMKTFPADGSRSLLSSTESHSLCPGNTANRGYV